MFNDANQTPFLQAINCMVAQYGLSKTPCLALRIVGQNRLMSNLSKDKNHRENYMQMAEFWLSVYFQDSNYSANLKSRLADCYYFMNL